MVRALLLALFLAGLTVVAGGWMVERWYQTGDWPLADTRPDTGMQPGGEAKLVPITVRQGMALPAVARALHDAGLLSQPGLWRYRVWLSGAAGRIQAGEYELPLTVTPTELLQRLTEGAVVLRRLTMIEGTTATMVLRQVQQAPGLKKVLPVDLGVGQLMGALGEPPGSAEGWFFPDTYQYHAGDSDRALLVLAHRRMKERLDAAWRRRKDDLPYRSPYELLIMASIVEKESGRSEDRPLVAQVFVNRLTTGMRLQTDPTVIYGLGTAFDGNLTRRHLQMDMPYNTYLRHGLPPTPIALPGGDALRAAANPPAGSYLYFVARGDGSTEFSESLAAHNAAVRRFQLGRKH